MSNALIEAIVEMEEADALSLVHQRLEDGDDPMGLITECTKAIKVVGQRFASGEYFLPHLMMAGDILKQISDIVKRRLPGDAKPEKLGKVMICTVQGDIHDIGKNIVRFLLDANGFEVKDLGVDVPIEKIVDEVKLFEPQVVGLSAMLTTMYDSVRDTIQAIRDAGLREQVRIMIGGAPMSQIVCDKVKADAYGKDAIEAVGLVQEWICGKRGD